MRCVLYDDETFEPLTVLNIPRQFVERMKDGELILLPVMEPVFFVDHNPNMPVVPSHLRTVSLRLERFVRKGVEHCFIFTQDSETALLLRSVFLSGQQNELQRREQASFAKGLSRAFGLS